jgi:hypothetical protein
VYANTKNVDRTRARFSAGASRLAVDRLPMKRAPTAGQRGNHQPGSWNGSLTEGFKSEEIPIPRTPQNLAKFEAHLDELRERLTEAERDLRSCRAANPLP